MCPTSRVLIWASAKSDGHRRQYVESHQRLHQLSICLRIRACLASASVVAAFLHHGLALHPAGTSIVANSPRSGPRNFRWCMWVRQGKGQSRLRFQRINLLATLWHAPLLDIVVSMLSRCLSYSVATKYWWKVLLPWAAFGSVLLLTLVAKE